MHAWLLWMVLVQDPGQKLEHKVVQGSTREVSVDFTLGLKIAGSDAAVDFVKSSESFLSFEKIHIRADGALRGLEGNRMRLDFSEGRLDGRYDDADFEYDFAIAEPPADLEKNKLKQTLWHLFAAGKEFCLSPMGEYRSEDKNQDATGEVMDLWYLSVLRMPDGAVQNGSEWEKTFRTEREQKDNQGRFEVTQKSKVEKIRNGRVHVASTFAGALVLPKDAPKDPNAKKSESSLEGKSKILFDPKMGEVVSSESSGKVRFYYQGVDGGSGEDLELEIVLTVESKIVPR